MSATITNDFKLAVLAKQVVGREHEIFSYQINIDNYTLMLLALPSGDWPEELVQYKKINRDNLNTVPEQYQTDVGDYLYRDRIAALLVTEKLEQGRAQRIYDVMLSQLPAEQKEILLTEASRSLAIVA